MMIKFGTANLIHTYSKAKNNPPKDQIYPSPESYNYNIHYTNMLFISFCLNIISFPYLGMEN